MNKETKAEINEAMAQIAKRKPGRSRLVYNKATRTIDVIDRRGLVERKVGTALYITEMEADLI